MFIQNLTLSNFRNISSFCAEFHKRFNIIFGDNAQGKSNLLESIYMLAFLKSTRTNSLGDIITRGQQKAAILSELDIEGVRRKIRLDLVDKRRNIILDAMPVNTLQDYLGIMRVILFQPSDVALLRSTPADRRSVLDRMLFNVKPVYIMDVKQYQTLVKQKSYLLRSESPDLRMKEVYDDEIIRLGTKIISIRLRFLIAFFPIFEEIFHAIFGESLKIGWKYKCSGVGEFNISHNPELSIEQCLTAFAQAVKSAHGRELAQKQVAIGPQRDDWSIQLSGEDAKIFASQGQQRAIVLAIKMAEIRFLKELMHIEPIFLLDDISSELDTTRNKQLFTFLSQFTAQVFLTTTSPSFIPFQGGCQNYHVSGGQISLVS